MWLFSEWRLLLAATSLGSRSIQKEPYSGGFLSFERTPLMQAFFFSLAAGPLQCGLLRLPHPTLTLEFCSRQNTERQPKKPHSTLVLLTNNDPLDYFFRGVLSAVKNSP